jgi:hypothetical protein
MYESGGNDQSAVAEAAALSAHVVTTSAAHLGRALGLLNDLYPLVASRHGEHSANGAGGGKSVHISGKVLISFSSCFKDYQCVYVARLCCRCVCGCCCFLCALSLRVAAEADTFGHPALAKDTRLPHRHPAKGGGGQPTQQWNQRRLLAGPNATAAAAAIGGAVGGVPLDRANPSRRRRALRTRQKSAAAAHNHTLRVNRGGVEPSVGTTRARRQLLGLHGGAGAEAPLLVARRPVCFVSGSPRVGPPLELVDPKALMAKLHARALAERQQLELDSGGDGSQRDSRDPTEVTTARGLRLGYQSGSLRITVWVCQLGCNLDYQGAAPLLDRSLDCNLDLPPHC